MQNAFDKHTEIEKDGMILHIHTFQHEPAGLSQPFGTLVWLRPVGNYRYLAGDVRVGFHMIGGENAKEKMLEWHSMWENGTIDQNSDIDVRVPTKKSDVRKIIEYNDKVRAGLKPRRLTAARYL